MCQAGALELAGVDVLGEASDGAEAVRLVLTAQPDVALMDVRMPVMEATRRIVAAGTRTRVLVLTTFDAEEHAYEALRAGAAGYLLKDVGGQRLVEAVEATAAGEMAAGARAGRPTGRAVRPPSATGRDACQPAARLERPRARGARAHRRGDGPIPRSRST